MAHFIQSEIAIYWLPPDSPSPNLIERLWGHLKRTVLANVLYKHLDAPSWRFEKAFVETQAIEARWVLYLATAT